MSFRRNPGSTPAPMVTSGRGPSPAHTVTDSFRSRPTGGWRPAVPGSGWCRISAAALDRRAASVRSRWWIRRRSSRPARSRAGRATAPTRTAGASSAGRRSRRRRRPGRWESSSTRRLQGTGRGQDEDGADPREVGTRLPGAAARGRQRCRDPGATRREAAGVGSLRLRAERAVSRDEQRRSAHTVRDAALARSVLAPSASLPRHERGDLPGNAGCRPGRGPARRSPESGLWVSGALTRQASRLQRPDDPLAFTP